MTPHHKALKKLYLAKQQELADAQDTTIMTNREKVLSKLRVPKLRELYDDFIFKRWRKAKKH